ncbi:MAG: type II secretion system minor pseudopilin GspK [Betaproteobacteria bacterium]
MRSRRPPLRSRARQTGAAILLALLIMTLVATLAAGMVWVQWRGIEVESAERARGQGEWLLNAALDWGNLILKSSIRGGQKEDDLGQPWATPLAETKLSSFLSADGSHSEEGGPEAFLSGQITDAQSKYNLYNLVNDGSGKPNEIVRLQILCTAIGVSPDVANTIASGMRSSWTAQQSAKTGGDQRDATNAVLMPIEVENLTWFGVDPAVVKQLQPFVQLLPASAVTEINANTAPAEVLMAALPGISRAQAQQIILRRQASPIASLSDVWAALNVSNAKEWPNPDPGPKNNVGFKSFYFEIYGQLRYEQHVIRERSIVYRKDQFVPVQVLRRERLAPDAT